ncbi:hypothetical protein E2C01_050343 [Portunus trituberculatus]|uniref:Uncharacterized protein n=1 Tax=Portunus trituberculatus TaxID=210409 RepID=A0A5B7GG86_PORTR|nr:hypothetical protein [Portunus trituberculatus]
MAHLRRDFWCGIQINASCCLILTCYFLLLLLLLFLFLFLFLASPPCMPDRAAPFTSPHHHAASPRPGIPRSPPLLHFLPPRLHLPQAQEKIPVSLPPEERRVEEREWGRKGYLWVKCVEVNARTHKLTC